MGLALPDAATLLAASGMLAVAVAWLELLRRATRREHEADSHRASR
jgi:hypothetical protein